MPCSCPPAVRRRGTVPLHQEPHRCGSSTSGPVTAHRPKYIRTQPVKNICHNVSFIIVYYLFIYFSYSYYLFCVPGSVSRTRYVDP